MPSKMIIHHPFLPTPKIAPKKWQTAPKTSLTNHSPPPMPLSRLSRFFRALSCFQMPLSPSKPPPPICYGRIVFSNKPTTVSIAR
jgi:hypothetical protein